MKKLWCSGLLLLAAVFASPVARAQQPTEQIITGPVRAYQFMQLTVVEGAPGYFSFSPEFNGQKVVELNKVYMDQLYSAKQRLALQGNEGKVMQALQEATAAGWELIQVSSQPIKQVHDQIDLTRYLFRKAK